MHLVRRLNRAWVVGITLSCLGLIGCGGSQGGSLSNLSPVASTSGPIGYVGCSMTMNAITGYEALAGKKFWPVVEYGGGGIYVWASDLTNTSTYWSTFQGALDANPSTQTIWWELCTLATDSPNDNYDNAIIVLKEIQYRLPNAIVYVSAQPAYSPGHICSIAGDGGPALMQNVADALVTSGMALQGPVMGPLSDSQLLSDGCHADTAGQEFMGQQLINFFGK